MIKEKVEIRSRPNEKANESFSFFKRKGSVEPRSVEWRSVEWTSVESRSVEPSRVEQRIVKSCK